MSDSILITGANRGIGLELAEVFGKNGWKVFACCRHPEKAEKLQQLTDEHSNITTYALDVDDQNSIDCLAKKLRGEAIDILFNNAGIFGPRDQSFGQIDAEVWLKVMRTNVVAPLKIIEAFVDHVSESQRKIVASMGSMMGSISDNDSGGYYVYRTSKAAVHMVMKSLSVDLRDRGITSVVFHPGWVKTDMGGPEAPTLPAESAAGLYQVLTGLNINDTGCFFTFEGKELPW